MSIPSYYYRNMLLQYDRQLANARRLARLNPKAPEAEGLDERQSEPGQGPSPESKRWQLVEKVARELFDNLLFTGSANPVVEEVRQELSQKLSGSYTFWYPPGELQVRILCEDSEGKHELVGEERLEVLTLLWEITLAKVDATIL